MVEQGYGRLRRTASRMIGGRGLLAELRPASTPGTRYPVRVVFADFNNRDVDGSLIQAADFVGLVAAADLPTSPAVGDQLFWEGYERAVVRVRPTKPGGEAVLYELQLRGRAR